MPHPDRLKQLRPDCQKCFGFCCTALFFSASEGFPADKKAGQPCINLLPDFRCRIHDSLEKMNFNGCIAFDCLGAGQKAAQDSFAGIDWRKTPQSAEQMFAVFLIMLQLHELLWYLTEAFILQADDPIHDRIKNMADEMERLTYAGPEVLLKLDLEAQWAQADIVLTKVSELVRAQAKKEATGGGLKRFRPKVDLVGVDLRKNNMRGANLRGSCLIAADLRGTDLSGADFIGADLRDTDFGGADLSKSIFLIQAQINTAKGNADTKLPAWLTRPVSWEDKTS